MKYLFWGYILFDTAILDFGNATSASDFKISIVGKPNRYSLPDLTVAKLESFGAKNPVITPWRDVYLETEHRTVETDRIYSIDFEIDARDISNAIEGIEMTEDFPNMAAFKLWRAIR